jgi:hypothetical protein
MKMSKESNRKKTKRKELNLQRMLKRAMRTIMEKRIQI